MVLLPKRYKFVEMIGGYRQYVAYVRFAAIARPDGICPVRKRNRSVKAKIDDYFHLSTKAMYVPRFVIHRVRRKSYSIEPERTHLLKP